MKRGWTILLMFSIGLNAGILYVLFSERWEERSHPPLQYTSPQNQERPQPSPAENSRDPGEVARAHLQRMTETLRLDRDQQRAVGEVLDEFLPQIISHEERVRELRVELAEQYAEPQTKANEVRSLVGELNRTQARLDSLVAETLLREVDLLTPDQRRLYVEIVPWGRPKQPQPGPRQDTSDPRQDRPEPRQEPPDRRSPPPDREPPPPPDRQPPPPDRQPPPPDRG